MNIKLSDLTAVGWLLTLLTIGLIFILMGGSVSLWNEILPKGRYPVILLAIPGLVPGIIFFMVSAWVLRAAGLPVVKPAPGTDGNND